MNLSLKTLFSTSLSSLLHLSPSSSSIIIVFSFLNILIGISETNFYKLILYFFIMINEMFSFRMLIKIQGNTKRINVFLCREYLNLLGNIMIILSTFLLNNRGNKQFINGIIITSSQFIYLDVFKYRFSKIFSLALLCILLPLSLSLDIIDYFVIIFACFIFILENLRKKLKESYSQDSKIKHSANIKNRRIAEIPYFYFKDNSDQIYILEKNLKVTCLNQYGESFLPTSSHSLEYNNMLKIKEGKYYIKRKFETSPSHSEIFEEMLKNNNNNNNNNNKESSDLNEILNILLSDNPPHTIIATLYSEKEGSEVLYFTKMGDNVLLKIKRDLFFLNCKKSQQIIENNSNAIAFVSHEFRTPLNCIVSMLQIMDQIVDLNITMDYIAPAVTSSKILLNLVNDLLDISQIEAGTFKLVPVEFELNVLLEDTIQIVGYQAKKRGLNLIFELDSQVTRVKTDPNRLRQIVTNLLSNAIKYTTKGSITITLQKISQTDSIYSLPPTSIPHRAPSLLQISVKDTGLGISEENISKLFKAFSKINGSADLALNSQGVGLGLVISNKIAFQLGGEKGGIKVESKLGEGSTFSFVFVDFMQKEEDDCIASLSSHKINILNVNDISKTASRPVHQRSTQKSISFSFELDKLMSRNSSEKKLLFNLYRHSFLSSLSISKGKLSSRKEKNSSMSFFFLGDSINLKDIKSRDFVEKEHFVENKMEKIKASIRLHRCPLNCPLALIIDDNDFNILALESHLKRLEILSQSALSCESAMIEIKQFDHNTCCKFFKIIFLDIEMPGKNGFDTFKEITEYYKLKKFGKIYIIAVTGHSLGGEIVERAKKVGFCEILTKPLSLEMIVLCLRKVLKQIFGKT